MPFPYSKLQARVVPHGGLANVIALISSGYITIGGGRASSNARPRRIFFTVEQNILRSTAVQVPENISLDTSLAINILHNP
jgi:hypothetical protein